MLAPSSVLATVEQLLNTDADLTTQLAWLARLTWEQVTPEDFVQVVTALRQPIAPLPGPVMDCCGTGGSGKPHFNTSTTVALVLATAGVPVAKFGNRAATSASGSFDFLDALRLSAPVPTEAMADVLAETGLLFLFAPRFYPQLGRVAQARKAFGQKTLFNALGPLLNPVLPAYRLVGVSEESLLPAMAQALSCTPGLKRAWLVSAETGEDDVIPDGRTVGLDVRPGLATPFAETHACPAPRPDGPLSVADNVARFHALVTGEDTASYAFHSVCVNAGAALTVAGRAENVSEGAAMAQALLASGDVFEQWQHCRRVYARYAG
jgi:anthranilate phosphoribosyltransferase